MASTAPARHITPRDIEIFGSLNRFPLTAEQLLKLSTTFRTPFTSLRRVQERFHVLTSGGYIRQYRYATVATGAAPAYYTLSLLGWRVFSGPKAEHPRKRAFNPISISLQEHTRSLVDFVVHTAVAVHDAGYCFQVYSAETDVTLQLGDERLIPDCAIQVKVASGFEFNFLVELDNGTEPVCSKKERESWEKKILFYDRYQDVCRERFRVLAITTRNSQRSDHILETASRSVQNSRRSLFYATTLTDYLSAADPLQSPCFKNHRLQRTALVSPLASHGSPNVTATKLALASVS